MLNKVNPGGTLPAFPGGTFNTLVDIGRRTNVGNGKRRDVLRDSFYWRNDSSEEAPLGAVFRFAGAPSVDNAVVVSGDKPDSAVQPLYGVSLEPVPAGGIGRAVTLTPVRVRFNDTSTPAFGEFWGPSAGQWGIDLGGSEFFILGDAREATVLAIQTNKRDLVLLGKTNEAIDKGDVGSVRVWIDSGQGEADTGNDVMCVNHFGDVAAGKWVSMAQIGVNWYLIAREC
jgi:hypothetical protein